MPTAAAPKKYLNSRSILTRYDKRDRSWLWRELRRNPEFPRPAFIQNGHPLWDAEKQDAYDAMLVARAEGNA